MKKEKQKSWQLYYLVLIVIEMLTGYFDDAAEKPWGEYLKGALDFAVAIVVAVVYLHFNSSTITFAIFGGSVNIPPVVFGILTVILVWVSINVTNCSDGVDGLIYIFVACSRYELAFWQMSWDKSC